MGLTFQMLLVTSTVGVLQSAFFGIYLFTRKKGRTVANMILAALLVVLAIRIFKSVGYYFSEGHVIPDVLMNFGFGCNLAIFPLLWLYLNAFLDRDFRFVWKRDLLHIVPAATILVLSPVLTDYFWLAQSGYVISLLGMLVYLPFCVHVVIKHFQGLNRMQRLWVLSLVSGITVVWLGYLGNYISGIVPYITAPVSFSFLVYGLSFVGLQEGSLFKHEPRHQASAFNPSQVNACHTALLKVLSERKPYLDPALTLPKLAGMLGVTPNLLSETINKRSRHNFPDFINSYRVVEARKFLSDQRYHCQKISAIAFETGFASLSVFNTAFKKFTTITPSAFRKKYE